MRVAVCVVNRHNAPSPSPPVAFVFSFSPRIYPLIEIVPPSFFSSMGRRIVFFPPPDPDHRWKIRIFLNSKRINTGEMKSNLWLEMGKRWISFSLDMSHRYEPGGRVQTFYPIFRPQDRLEWKAGVNQGQGLKGFETGETRAPNLTQLFRPIGFPCVTPPFHFLSRFLLSTLERTR